MANVKILMTLTSSTFHLQKASHWLTYFRVMTVQKCPVK